MSKQKAVEPPVVKLPHGGETQLINFAKGLWAKLPSTVQSRDGRTVTLKHHAQGTEEVLFEHLTTSHDKTGRTWVDRARVKSILRITSTIENARPRFIAGNGNHIYIQRYADGFNHYVVTKPDGLVVEHGLSDTLQTQWLRDAAGDAYLPAKKLDFGSPSSARSEQGGAAGTTKTSPSQSNIAPGMPGEAGPVREGAGQGDAGQGENGQQQGGSSSIESTALTEKSAGASQSSTEKQAPVNDAMEPSFSVGLQDKSGGLDVQKFKAILQNGDTAPLPAGLQERAGEAIERHTAGGISRSELRVEVLPPVLGGRNSDGFGIASAVAALFGRRVVRFDVAPKAFSRGWTTSGIPEFIFVNKASSKPALVVSGHELWHHLQIEQQDITDQIKKKLGPDFIRLNQASKSYRKFSEKEYVDEMMGDFMTESLIEPAFWDKLSERDPEFFGRAAIVIKEWIDGLINSLRVHLEGSQYIRDLERAQNVLADAA